MGRVSKTITGALLVGLSLIATLMIRAKITEETPLPEVVDHRSGAIFQPQAAPESQISRVTAYCPCELCCGQWSDGFTASGRPAMQGRTAAADASLWDIGSCIDVPGVGHRVIEDTGSAMIGRRLDIYFDSHEEALRFGVRLLPVGGCDAQTVALAPPSATTPVGQP